MALDPTIKALLGAMTAMNAPPMSQGTAQHAREQFRTLTVGLRQPQWVVPVGNVEGHHVRWANESWRRGFTGRNRREVLIRCRRFCSSTGVGNVLAIRYP